MIRYLQTTTCWLSLGILGLLVSGCRSWQTARDEVVQPIQTLLHRDYPEAVEAGGKEHLQPLFVGSSSNLGPTLELLSHFSRVEDARAVIQHATENGDQVRAELHIQVEGEDPAGKKIAVLQEKILHCSRANGEWKIDRDESKPLTIIPTPGASFSSEGPQKGLIFKHEIPQVPTPDGEMKKFVLGAGAAVADMDGDGWEDVILASGNRVRLFRNHAGKLVDESKLWGLDFEHKGALTVTLLFDFDNDGRKDLFLGCEFNQPILLRNEGHLLSRVPDSGITTTGRNISGCVADFNNDGNLDLFLANNEEPHWKAPVPLGFAANAEPDQLYLGNGDGTFRDATEQSGIHNTGWSLVCGAADYDLDGNIDLYVGNDFGSDRLYRNLGGARFEEVSDDAGVNAPIASMGADWGDFDGDGDFDLFVGGMSSTAAWMIDQPDFPSPVPWLIDVLFRKHVRKEVRAFFHGNRFYENQGDGTFTEISTRSGTANSGWAWGSVFLDFDNDGKLDIYTANGFISGPIKDDL